MLHERVALAQEGRNPTVIGKMRSGWAVLGDNQNIPGYCLLLADPVVEDIHALESVDQVQFLADMVLFGGVLKSVLGADLINYSILGNADRGLHAHIHPRYTWESPEFRTKNPFKYYWASVPDIDFSEELHRDLIEKIRIELEQVLN